ncbi:MAG: MgtC/SapB family protein [Acidobacteriaceae bacterium]|nr:MgtC/SapB family protein [Acidobacteriaceae bacterium]
MLTFQHIYQVLHIEMTSVVGVSITRLVLAAILGGVIGLEREAKRRPAGLRTNLFICLGSAMFTLLSDALAVEHIGDHTRIAAQVIPGIGFIGAGSIIHAQGGLVIGLTTAATLFVVASIGMAVGGGLYLTAIFATLLILLCLLLLGKTEERLGLKLSTCVYEASGSTLEDVTAELNRLLEPIHGIMDNVRSAVTKQHVRLQFELSARARDHERFVHELQGSRVLHNAVSLGPVHPE